MCSRAISLLLLLVAGAFAGCAGQTPSDRDAKALRTAWAFLAERNPDAALPVVRAFVQENPGDPAGHFLMGKCFLHRSNANTTIALGEFETAIALHSSAPDKGFPEAGLDTGASFAAALHRDAALSLMRAVYDASGTGVPVSLTLPALRRTLDHVRKGLEHAPDDAYLREMLGTLEGLHPPDPPERRREITI